METPHNRRTLADVWSRDPDIPVAGTDTYEVLPGGYFLVHHVDVTVGDKPVRAIEIIGEPDAVSGGFLAELRQRWERRADALDRGQQRLPLHRRSRGCISSTADRRLDCSSPIHADRRRRRTIDDRPMGAVRGWHQLAALDGYLVQAE